MMSENIPNRTSSDPMNMDGSSDTARVRTQSECSALSDDGLASNIGIGIGKRQRTTSQTFMVTSALTSASPPKFVSLEEIMQAANSMKDMAIVHEIVVDNEFRLERYEPQENSLHKAIKENMVRAYWDLFRKNFEEDPPNYENALVLLEDIKQGLFDLLLPQHTKLRQQIAEVLDSALIKQQVEQGILDFKHYSQYVISVMGKLCAPVRDEKIKELTERTDIVDTFRGILETLDLMALDMANFTITFAKPEIIAQSVEYERKKFADYLAIHPDGLEITRKWLLRHLNPSVSPSDVDHATYVRNHMKDTLLNAVIELLEWAENEPYPETFMMDEERLKLLQTQSEKTIFMGTILLIVMSSVGSDLNTLTSFKTTLKDHISIIMQSYKKKSDINELLPSIAIQVIKDVKEAQQDHSMPEITEENEKMLTSVIVDVVKDDHKIRKLVQQRVKEFFHEIIMSCTAAPQKVPSGLTSLQQELTAIAGQYLRIISHNTSVFSGYYREIIDQALPPLPNTLSTLQDGNREQEQPSEINE